MRTARFFSETVGVRRTCFSELVSSESHTLKLRPRSLSKCSVPLNVVVLYLLSVPTSGALTWSLVIMILFLRKYDFISGHFAPSFLTSSPFSVKRFGGLSAWLALVSPILIDEKLGNVQLLLCVDLRAVPILTHHVGHPFWSLGMTPNVACPEPLDHFSAATLFGFFCLVVELGSYLR